MKDESRTKPIEGSPATAPQPTTRRRIESITDAQRAEMAELMRKTIDGMVDNLNRPGQDSSGA